MRIETAILKHLIYDEEYLRRVLPFLKHEYFMDKTDKILFEEIQELSKIGEISQMKNWKNVRAI
jgi:replicative DNA helicase